jgi:acetylornithine deacetylase/succinyl-diaminopimelate desuccinylase-like protein
MFGNTIPNAIHEMIKILQPIFGTKDDITIPGFRGIAEYKSLRENFGGSILADNTSLIEQLSNLEINKSFVKDDSEFQLKNGLMPAFILSGITGGFTGEGYANIVPNTAKVKINLRFGPTQDAQEITEAVKKYFEASIPKYLLYNLKIDSITNGTLIDTTNLYFAKFSKILDNVYPKKVVYKFVGGSLPIVSSFVEHLKAPLMSIPLANSSCNMHGVSENFNISNIALGLKFCNKLYTQ